MTHDYSIECGLTSINMQKKECESLFLKEIHVGKNVFIGYSCIILPGTNIGDNVIIGAGSIVRGNIESNSIYCGNPVKKVFDLSEWAQKKVIEHEYIDGTKN